MTKTTTTTNENAAVTAVKDVSLTSKRHHFTKATSNSTEQTTTKLVVQSSTAAFKSTTNKSYKSNSILDPYRNELEVIILMCCYLLLVIYVLVPTSSWIHLVGVVQASNHNTPFSPRSGSTSTSWMTKIGSSTTTTVPKGPFQGLSSYNTAARGGSAITVSKRKMDGVHDLESYLRERQQQKQFTNEDYYTSYDDNNNHNNDDENVVAMETSMKTETTTTTTTTNNNVVEVEEPIDEEVLIKETRHFLNVKLHEVLTGQRGRSFAKQYGKKRDAIDGAFTSSDGILSTHGRRSTTKTTKTTSSMTTKTSTPATSTKTTRNQVVQSSTTKDELNSSVLDVLHELELEDELKEPSALRLLIRALRLSWNFAPIYLTCGLAYFSPTFRTNIWYKWLSKCLAKSGPAFIKWGQWASTRQDMFPNELCQELSSLHASAPAHSWKFTQTTVEQALKLPKGTLLEVFESFDPQPLASGSIAQVHRAVLKPDPYYTPNVLEQEYTKLVKQLPSQVQQHVPSSIFPFTDQHREEGMTVAVKVRHPMVAELIDWDFRIMLRLADVVDSIPALRWLNVRSSVEQFSHTMAAQSHLNVEAHHLDVLNYNFRHWSKIGFPKPFFSHPTMICETFESGRIVTDIIDDYEQQQTRSDDDLTFQTPGELLNSNNNNDKDIVSSCSSADHIPLDLAEFLVTNGLSIYLKMLLVDNLMHADLHPGNIMCCINDCMRRKRQPYQSKKKQRNADDNTKKMKNQTIKTKAVVGQVGGDIATESKKMMKQKNARKEKTSANRRRKDEDDCGCDGDVSSGTSNNNNKNDDYPFEANMILVDAGMVARLEEEEADNFIGFMASLGEGDGKQAALAALNFSSSGSSDGEQEFSLSEEQRDAFIQDMEDMFSTYCRGYGTNVDVGEILRQVLQLIRIHKVRIDANYATLVINALCIEGLAKRVAPTYNVLDAAQPLLQSYYRICGTSSRSRRFATDRNYKIRHAIMRCWMPLMYIKKSAKDKIFFWKLKRQRRLEASTSTNTKQSKHGSRSSRQNIMLTKKSSHKKNPKFKQTLIEALVGTGIFLLAVHLIPESLVTNKLSDVRQGVVDTFNSMTSTFNELGQCMLDVIPDTVKDIFSDNNNSEETTILSTKKGKGKAQ